MLLQVFQGRTKIGSTLGSPILAIIAGLLCGMLGMRFSDASKYRHILKTRIIMTMMIYEMSAGRIAAY